MTRENIPQTSDQSVLVIVPCGQAKVWDKYSNHGATEARDAYTGSPFIVNRQYAEHFGEKWMILSAKYGFIEPEFKLPGPYNVTFKRKSTGPVSEGILKEQVEQLELARFPVVIGLGGKEYRQAIKAAFAGKNVELQFPFAGLPIGKAMQAVKQAMESGSPTSASEKATPKPKGENETVRLASEPEAMTANSLCSKLHELVQNLPVHQFPFEASAIPTNGIYMLFQKGESGHGASRIVRVGTHTGDNQLPSRLKQHFLNENKDRSIFRKNIGRCILNRESDPYLKSWELDLTSRAAREEHQDNVDFDKQNQIEQKVTEYLQSNFWFVVLDIPDKDTRLRLESKIVSTVSLCDQCRPSPSWLGLSSPNEKIHRGGLWQVNELWKTPLSNEDLSLISDFANC